MDPGKSIGAQLTAASQLEKTGQLAGAAAIYQKLFDSDPANKQVIARLLIVYRKLKDYKKELSVLRDALAAYKLQQKTARDQWIQSHPKAASAGKSMLRQLEKAGGAGAGMAGDPSIEGWLKRKQLVMQKITGKTTKVTQLPRQSKKIAADTSRKTPSLLRSQNLTKSRQRQKEPKPSQLEEKERQRKQKQRQLKEKHHQQKQEKQRQLKEKQHQQKQEKQRQQKEEKQHRQEQARIAREKAARERREAAALLKQEKQELKRIAAEEARKKKQQPISLFVILLTYQASLDKIDAAMKQHMAYLTKHYDNGSFLVSGRQIPRTGGVILARASNKAAVEKTVNQDPFIKRKLATADIIEFNPSQMARGLRKWLIPDPKQ